MDGNPVSSVTAYAALERDDLCAAHMHAGTADQRDAGALQGSERGKVVVHD